MTMNAYLDLQAFCRVAAEAYPSNSLYCLADHAGMPGLHRQLVQTGVAWNSLFHGSAEESALPAAPLLFPLLAANARLLEWIAEHGTYTSSMLMLSSPLGLEELRDRLARRMRARISDEMNVLLRFFDPRVFEVLVDVLDEEQRDRFLNPAQCWWYPDRSGQLRSQPAKFAVDEYAGHLELSAAQEFALVDASEIDQVAQQLRSMLPDAYIRMTPVQRAGFLRRHMADAGKAGVVATHEVALYCGLALLHGEEFAHRPPWRDMLVQVGEGSSSLIDVVSAHER